MDNNRNAPERLNEIGELQHLSESGDCERYAASSQYGEQSGEARSPSITLRSSQSQIIPLLQ